MEAVVPRHELEKYGLGEGDARAAVAEELRDEKVDFCIAIGGDGTILRAFNRFRGFATPVMGINFGRVGFLSAIGPDDIQAGLPPFLRGEYETLELALLETGTGGERQLAINDLVVHKPDGGSVIRLGYEVEGVEMDTFNCDGLVASTPAGSTAYNLSCGGPLVSLNLDAVVLTAIAPHTLRARTMVLAPGDELLIRNYSLGAAAAVYLDGRHAGSVEPGGDISVSLAAERAQLVIPPGAGFFPKMRDKFIRR